MVRTEKIVKRFVLQITYGTNQQLKLIRTIRHELNIFQRLAHNLIVINFSLFIVGINCPNFENFLYFAKGVGCDM